MLSFLKSMLGVILIAVLGYGLYHMATKSADDSLKTLHVSADSTATIVGTVLANQNDCFKQKTGSRCFLRLRVSEKDVFVVYNTNDSAFCANESVAIAGKGAREGSTVKVYGYYQKDDKTDTILTCPSPNYYIQTL